MNASPNLFHRHFDRSLVCLAVITLGLAALAGRADAQDATPEVAPAPEPEIAPEAASAAETPDAAPATETSPDASADGADEVQTLLAEAIAEYDAARYPEALALFQRAHAISPTARTLRGIGMAAFESGQYVLALSALRASLVGTERPLTPEQRDHVTRLIARTEVFVATLDLEVSPPDAEVRIDGAAITREADGSVLLDQGHHTVTASDSTGRAQTLEVDLVGGTRRAIRVQLEEAGAGSVAPTTIAGITLMVGGALGAVAAIATGVIALDLESRLATECEGFVCSGDLRDAGQRAADLSIATDVTGSIAAALMAAGVVLTLVGETTGGPAPVALACGPLGCTATLEL